jgi:hypothetical protein
LLADLYKSKLEAAGIPVLLRYESAGMVFGITVDGLGEVRVMVPAEFAAEAESLLTEPSPAEPEEHLGDCPDRPQPSS